MRKVHRLSGQSVISVPSGSLVVMAAGDGCWVFDYPRLTSHVLDLYYEGIDLFELGELASAERCFHRLIYQYPEFIASYHQLALVLDEDNRAPEALHVWEQAVALGLSHLPPAFRMGIDQLPWALSQNRPFLQVYRGLGLALLEQGDYERALDIFDNLLAMNTGDNQGIRALAIGANFQLNRPASVLAICDRYPSDTIEHIVFGRPLALHQLGCLDDAMVALRDAIEMYPKIGEQLLKHTPDRPGRLSRDRVTVGGSDQAFWYWQEDGLYWRETPGALELLEKCLDECNSQGRGEGSGAAPEES